jgi:hypothetical protein
MICGKLKELAMMGLQAASRRHGLLLQSGQDSTSSNTLGRFVGSIITDFGLVEPALNFAMGVRRLTGKLILPAQTSLIYCFPVLRRNNDRRSSILSAALLKVTDHYI